MADNTLGQVGFEAFLKAIDHRCDAAASWRLAPPEFRAAWEAAAGGAAETERERITALLRRAAAGRREYAGHEDDGSEARAILLKSAEHYESAAWLLEDPRNMLDVMPSWMWTDEEHALLRERP
jgi:acyl-CoA reductase-like NAD-dependent aldehyde dehydrogenase